MTSVGEPGYLPYCGRCDGLRRMERGERAFECRACGLVTRIVNGEDMFDRTAPRRAWTPPSVRRLVAGSAETDLVAVGTSVVPIEDAAAERERQARAAAK